MAPNDRHQPQGHSAGHGSGQDNAQDRTSAARQSISSIETSQSAHSHEGTAQPSILHGPPQQPPPPALIGPPPRPVMAIAHNPLADRVAHEEEDDEQANVNVQANPMFRGDDEDEEVEEEDEDAGLEEGLQAVVLDETLADNDEELVSSSSDQPVPNNGNGNLLGAIGGCDLNHRGQCEMPVNCVSKAFPHNRSSSNSDSVPANISSHKDVFDMRRFAELVGSHSSRGERGSNPPFNAPAAAASGAPLGSNSNSYVFGGFPQVSSPKGMQHVAGASGLHHGQHPNGQGGPQAINVFNWQASKGCVRERLKSIFNQETLADVHFILGRGDAVGHGPRERVPAHKFVLSIGSAVFDAMFNGNLATSSEEIELPDVEPAAFLALLRFLYTDEVQIGPETVMTTLYTAKKYAVPALEKACVDFLKSNLSPDNAFMLLTQARLFDEPVLARMCLDIIDKQTVEALAAEGFLDIDHPTLCSVLERDTLRIREVGLFNAVVRWAEQECARQGLASNPDNQRRVLAGAVNLIRFPLMTVEEFAVDVAQSGLLQDREIVELFLYFTVNPKPAVPFPDNPRCCITGKEQVVGRFSRTESRWGYSGTSDRIRFTVDKRIFVMGFGLYGSIHGPSDYDCNIQIIHTGSGKVLASNDTTFSCDGSASTFRVLFKLPVEINPNTNYTACTTLKGSDSHYGTGGNRKVVVDLHGGGKVTFQFSYAAGCNNGTSVEDGQIPEIIFYT